MTLGEAVECLEMAAHAADFPKAAVLCDGVSVRDAAQHHALDDGAVFLLRQAAVRHQRGGQLGGRGGVNALQPLVALDLVQGRPFLRISLQHMSY